MIRFQKHTKQIIKKKKKKKIDIFNFIFDNQNSDKNFDLHRGGELQKHTS